MIIFTKKFLITFVLLSSLFNTNIQSQIIRDSIIVSLKGNIGNKEVHNPCLDCKDYINNIQYEIQNDTLLYSIYINIPNTIVTARGIEITDCRRKSIMINDEVNYILYLNDILNRGDFHFIKLNVYENDALYLYEFKKSRLTPNKYNLKNARSK